MTTEEHPDKDNLSDVLEEGQKQPTKTYEIIVNSRPRVVEDQQVTFEQIVQLAFPGAHDANVIFR